MTKQLILKKNNEDVENTRIHSRLFSEFVQSKCSK